jgi:putative membrane protein
MKPVSMTAMALAAALTLGSAAAFGQAMSDQEFVTNAIQGDMAEVQIGQLAETKGASDGVRNFGQMLAMDHDNAKAAALNVANSLGVTPPTAPKPEAQDEYNKLSSLSGAAFDAEFVRAMIADHQKDIQEFQDEASSGNGPASKMASDQLPTLQKHLAAAQALNQQATP